MLTDKAVRAAAPKDKAYKISDSGGLFLHVSPRNHKSWRLKYRLDGKEQLLTLGTYPEVSLAEAREKRNDARKLLREGRDPRVSAKRAKLVGDSGSLGGDAASGMGVPLVLDAKPRALLPRKGGGHD